MNENMNISKQSIWSEMYKVIEKIGIKQRGYFMFILISWWLYIINDLIKIYIKFIY